MNTVCTYIRCKQYRDQKLVKKISNDRFLNRILLLFDHTNQVEIISISQDVYWLCIFNSVKEPNPQIKSL